MSGNNEPTPTEGENNAISRRRNWPGIVVSSVFGGAIAVIAAPTIAALMPIGAVGLIAGTTTTGVLGSLVTRVTGNAIDASSVTLTIQQYPTQQFYRQTVITYIGATLEAVLDCLRKNTELKYENRVYFDLSDAFRFQDLDANEKRRMFFDFSFRVVPKANSRRRALQDSTPPIDLPTYDHGAKREIFTGGNKSLLDGTGRAVVEGVIFGSLGGALAKMVPILGAQSVIPIVRDKVGIIVGMSSCTGLAGPVKNITFPADSVDKAALFVEFVTEVQCHVNRLIQCATDNDMHLEVDMKIGSNTKTEASIEHAKTSGAENQSFYWSATAVVG